MEAFKASILFFCYGRYSCLQKQHFQPVHKTNLNYVGKFEHKKHDEANYGVNSGLTKMKCQNWHAPELLDRFNYESKVKKT